MLVIAFDGVLFDTLDARAMIVSDALAAEGLALNTERVRQAITGRTFSEAIRFLAPVARPDEANPNLDETSLDVAIVRAHQAFAALAARGFSLNISARDALLSAASVTRVVLRADSRRRDVDALLALSGLDSAVSHIRCSDDPAPRAALRSMQPSLRDHYMQATTPSCSACDRTAVCLVNVALLVLRSKRGALAQAVATAHGFDTAPSVSALHFPPTLNRPLWPNVIFRDGRG